MLSGNVAADDDEAMERNLVEFSGALDLAEITDLQTENPGELSPLQKAVDLGLNHHVQVSSHIFESRDLKDKREPTQSIHAAWHHHTCLYYGR